MPVIISKEPTTLSTANGFYRVEAHNLGCFSTTNLALTTTRTIDVTFANAGDCQGILLNLITVSISTRSVVVRLQENVASVWTTRAEKTLATEDIAGDKTSGTYIYRGQYITPVMFDTPYTVDTTASKWRFEIAHGTGSGTWQLRTSNGTAPFYATWCNNALTFADNDILICKDKVIIDKTATIGAVTSTGDTANGVGIILCTDHTDPTPENVAKLEWENPPTASYTFTIRGQVIMGSYSGFRVGTEEDRIPIAQKANIVFGAAFAGTVAPRFVTPTAVAASTIGGLSSLFLYGEIPTHQVTFLTENANAGQAKLQVTDNVDWVNGDQVVVGKKDIQGQGVVTIHTVSSVTGKEITLTTNLGTSNRIEGGSVIKLGGRGIEITSTSALIPIHIVWACANFQISGVDLFNQRFSMAGTTNYYLLAALDSTCKSQYLIEDCSAWTDSNSVTYLITSLSPEGGVLIQRVYGHRQHIAAACTYYSHAISGFKSGRTTIKDCVVQGQYASNISTSANIRLTYENNRVENSRTSYALNMTGMEGVYKDNYFWGGAATEISGGTVRIGQCINPQEISGNTFENNLCALVFANLPNVQCLDEGATFINNTTDLGFVTESFPDYTFQDPSGLDNISYENAIEMVVGGSVRFVNVDQQYDDRVIYTFGRTRRCKEGLADETVHTAGGSAIRFNPVSATDMFEFSFYVPTGNIQGQTMTVAVWCKVGSEAYWAGGHTMPGLKVRYDEATYVTLRAAQNTDWQLLSVTFTPTTTRGKIQVTLEGVTAADEADGYFYWDDMSILYPAGYKLDLGSLDIWDNALPVLPPIATVMGAGDVWAIDTSTLTGAGTIGKSLAGLKNPSMVIDGVIV